MSRARATLVLTTIGDLALLEEYWANFRVFGHLDDVQVIVVPDRKTPPEAFSRCRELAKKGLHVQCPTIAEQEDLLAKAGVPATAVPYNSDNRRNVGYLMAWAADADFLISIDDDNYCRPEEDFFAGHAAVRGGVSSHTVTESATGFFNICSLLEFERPAPVYARGFPYFARHRDEVPDSGPSSAAVHINAGLWTLDPDVDGITWLVAAPRVKSFRGAPVVLGPRTWTPVNSQNTALLRDCIPAYYFLRMGYPIMGMPIDRYGDIFSGYFVQACAKHLGACVRVGTPVAEHRRNRHDYKKDATNEWACILALEDLLPWLTEIRLSGSSYTEAYRSLSFALQDAVETFRGPVWTDLTRAYFHQVAYHMRLWLRACDCIAGAA